MGVALPNGNMETVASILATNDYMGWRACSAEEAQAAADRGTAAIAVTEDAIHILPAAEDTLNSDAAVVRAVDEAVAYYTYSCATTQTKTWAEYAEDLISVAQSKLGKTYAELNAEHTNFSIHPKAWCVDFVCLCCDLACLSSANGQVIVPDTSSSEGMRTWFADRGMYHEGSTGIQRGDIVFTAKKEYPGEIRHTCIALSSVISNRFNAIHGNWPDEVDEDWVYTSVTEAPDKEKHYILGYAHPNYELANNA